MGLFLLIILSIPAFLFLKSIFEKIEDESTSNQQQSRVNPYRPPVSSGQGNGTGIRSSTNGYDNRVHETGMMIYYANDPHRLSDNEYRFNYKKVGRGWRAYILKTPQLNGRAGTCHILSDNQGRYVCWDRELYSLKEVQTVSRQWADLNQKYIATGVSF